MRDIADDERQRDRPPESQPEGLLTYGSLALSLLLADVATSTRRRFASASRTRATKGKGFMKRNIKNAAIYRALKAASALARTMPLGMARALGRRIGSLAFHVVPRERHKALRNLNSAFPDLGSRERDTLARRCFQHLGASLFEIAWLARLDPRLFASTTRIEGLEHLRSAAEAGRGAVLFTGHCGNWEWMAASIALAGFSMKVIARELYDSRINDYIVDTRAKFGVETIRRGTTGAAREILSTLRSGAILGVLIDQSLRAENAMIPFFGIPAPTPIGPAQIAIRAGSMAIAGFIERRGAQQVVTFQPPIATQRGDDPVALTREMTGRIEEQIRRVPEQWVWMHDRWRER